MKQLSMIIMIHALLALPRLVVPAHQLVWHLLAIQGVVSCLLPYGGLLLNDSLR